MCCHLNIPSAGGKTAILNWRALKLFLEFRRIHAVNYILAKEIHAVNSSYLIAGLSHTLTDVASRLRLSAGSEPLAMVSLVYSPSDKVNSSHRFNFMSRYIAHVVHILYVYSMLLYVYVYIYIYIYIM